MAMAQNFVQHLILQSKEHLNAQCNVFGIIFVCKWPLRCKKILDKISRHNKTSQIPKLCFNMNEKVFCFQVDFEIANDVGHD